MEEIQLLSDLFDRKIVSILKTLYREPERQFYLLELSKASSVPIATASRIIYRLSKLDIIEVTKIAKFKLYRIKKGEAGDYLGELFREQFHIVEHFVQRIEHMNGLQQVILHGKETKEKANLLIIGDNIDSGEIKSICAEIHDKYSFKISSLTLTEEQYVQMSQMGLYPGQKKVLFERLDEKL